MSGSRLVCSSSAFARLAGCPGIVVLILCSMFSASHANAQFCFSPAVNYAVGTTPQSVFAADLDGDGDQDLAVANYSNPYISVLKNDGYGTYAAAVNYAVGTTPQSVFAADLDGDGDQDLAVANSSSGNVSVLKNNGDGTYVAPVNYAVGLNPKSVFAADLDGDGDRDLAVANYSGGNVSVLKNNGDGTFSAAVSYTVGTNPHSVVAADLDSDADRDLAVANWNSDSVSVLKNNGDGTFAAAVNYAAGDGPNSVFASDLDGDGDQDLAVANFGSADVSVLKNNGDGTYAAEVSYAGGNAPYSVFAADLDGDGDKDLAVANDGSANVSALKNNGDGTYASAVNYATGPFPASVFATDLDGDGGRDLAVANSGGDNVSIIKNCLLPIVVSTLGNSGIGSMRAAIDLANARSGPDTIAFTVAGTIQILTPLPPLSEPGAGTFILGFTAPGASSPYTPTVILDGSSCTPGPGLDLRNVYNRVERLTIRNFHGAGVALPVGLSFYNTITANQIYGNSGLGIDLWEDGVTPNDPGDADAGPNNLLNYPVFDSVVETGRDTFAVYGTAAPFSRVELFLASESGNLLFQPEATNHGPAYRLLGWTTASVSGLFSLDSIAKPEWSYVSATATDALGNTSEFAQNKALTPDPLRFTAYSEPVLQADRSMSLPTVSPALQVKVFSPPDSTGKVDSIGPSFNTFESRATYDSLTDFNSGGRPDTRVKIVSPDTGKYMIKYVLIGDPGSYLTGIGIDGHAEIKNQVAFAAVGQVESSTYRLAPPSRGELTGDGVIDVFDVIASIDVVFSGAPAPDPPELVDVNCDGVPDVFDVIYLIDYAFSGGPSPCQ